MIHAMRERTKLDRPLLEKLATTLKLITTTGMRNRGIDLECCKELGITVSGTDSEETRSASGTVEQTWALILALSRRVVKEHENLTRPSESRGEVWQTGVATGLKGKTLGLIGVGRLGKQVVQVGKAFGMRVMGWSPNLTKERAEEAGVELAGSLEELMRTSDVVSLHIILSEKTRGMLGYKEVGWMKRTAFLINTSRGPLINGYDLLYALTYERIAGAGLDVFDDEPLPKNHLLRTFDNVVLSPHMGYVETPQYETWFKQTVENAENFLDGQPIRVMQ
ncbi:D-2-hydroxyacid dehydrogenase family protein [Sporobolomyces salmoneus]|uniref:D-2-hydroxyacid dehydrogenase family protein n=1 Tax=Sporobolomyces salmoneus TaxID=183962 RepID=UPI00317C0946